MAGRWLVANPHLTGDAAAVAKLFERTAHDLLKTAKADSPELEDALKTLTAAKDQAVRAALLGEGNVWPPL